MTTSVGGFHPFDMLAVAYVAEPRDFRCTLLHARLAPEKPVDGRPILLVGERVDRVKLLTYCHGVSAVMKTRTMSVFGVAGE